MNQARIHVQWNSGSPLKRFQTGLSLHSHTLHSRESLGFIYKAAAEAPILAHVLRKGHEQYRLKRGASLDLDRGWWTPPLSPFEAWKLERQQIESLGYDALVSLTDHDDIEAPVSLQVLDECRDVPISFEWTVPFGPTFFHIGLHNLPLHQARPLFEELHAVTGQPCATRVAELLALVASDPASLIVFNHPFWDENRIGADLHTATVRDFMDKFGAWLHAIELNGLRPWTENLLAIELAKAWEKPVISGGDRHGFEPNALLNLTTAGTFGEFAEEVRAGYSDVLIMKHYRESLFTRILHNMADILRTHEAHAQGWRLWSDRVFYQFEEGEVRSLTQIFGLGTPAPIRIFVGGVQFVSQPLFRRWLRDAFAQREFAV